MGANSSKSSRVNHASNLYAPAGHRRSRSTHSTRTRHSSNYSPSPPPYDYSHTVRSHIEGPDYNSLSKSRSLSPKPKHHDSNKRLSKSYLREPIRKGSLDNVLATLEKYDTVIIVDDSGSMNEGNKWPEARNAIGELAELAGRHDADGIDVHFLHHREAGRGLRSKQDVFNLFDRARPIGMTPIGERLESLLFPYLDSLEKRTPMKPVNYIIITDGIPTDDPESVIVAAAERLDALKCSLTQVGIQFVQIGNHAGAEKYLRHLDDNLVNQFKLKRDIVDTTPFFGEIHGDALIKILLGGINRRVDREGAKVFRDDVQADIPGFRFDGPY